MTIPYNKIGKILITLIKGIVNYEIIYEHGGDRRMELKIISYDKEITDLVSTYLHSNKKDIKIVEEEKETTRFTYLEVD